MTKWCRVWTSGHAVGDVSGLRKDTAGLAQLHHSISADASFLAQAEMIQAQAHAQANLEAQARAQVAVNLPALAPMPDIRRLNAEQASRFQPNFPQHMLPTLAWVSNPSCWCWRYPSVHPHTVVNSIPISLYSWLSIFSFSKSFLVSSKPTGLPRTEMDTPTGLYNLLWIMAL